MIIAPLFLALVLTSVVDQELREKQLMNNADHSFRAFQDECRATFDSVIEGSVIIVSHTVSDHEPNNTFLSTYQYKVATPDGGQRGPYKFECRQAEGGKMSIYSEI